MTEDEFDPVLDPRARSAETKKKRTRAKLIQAVDLVMRDEGLNATVEEIAEEAGVSPPTFYNYYKSLNLLCVDAFEELVLLPIERMPMSASVASERRLYDTAQLILAACHDRRDLVRAAMIGRLESYDYEARHPYLKLVEAEGFLKAMGYHHFLDLTDEPGTPDFVDRVAILLADKTVLAEGNHWGNILTAVRGAALNLLDSCMQGVALNGFWLEQTTYAAAAFRMP